MSLPRSILPAAVARVGIPIVALDIWERMTGDPCGPAVADLIWEKVLPLATALDRLLELHGLNRPLRSVILNRIGGSILRHRHDPDRLIAAVRHVVDTAGDAATPVVPFPPHRR